MIAAAGGALAAWDRSLFLAVNQDLRARALDRLMPLVSDMGVGWVQVLFVLGLAVLVGTRAREVRVRAMPASLMGAVRSRAGWVGALLTAFALAGLASTIIKNTTARDRPWWFYHHEHLAGRHLDVKVRTIETRRPLRVRGFPSGHTSTSVALATALTILAAGQRRRRWAVAVAWAMAALIGFSRVYIADHWPLDVLGGIAIGLAAGATGGPLWRALAVRPRWARRAGAGGTDSDRPPRSGHDGSQRGDLRDPLPGESRRAVRDDLPGRVRAGDAGCEHGARPRCEPGHAER